MTKFYSLSVILLLLLGCNQKESALKHSKPPADSLAAITNVQFFECGDDLSFTAVHQIDSVRLFQDKKIITLPRVVSASGVKFKHNDYLFWTKGEEALVTLNGKSIEGCKNNPARAAWEKARFGGVDFRAIGQEPGWELQIQDDRHIRFTYNYGKDTVYTPVPQPNKTSPTTYRAKTEAHTLTATIYDTRCTDSMDGTLFFSTVSVTLDGVTYKGCGKYLKTP